MLQLLKNNTFYLIFYENENINNSIGQIISINNTTLKRITLNKLYLLL